MEVLYKSLSTIWYSLVLYCILICSVALSIWLIIMMEICHYGCMLIFTFYEVN
jgi:hypothetical protein